MVASRGYISILSKFACVLFLTVAVYTDGRIEQSRKIYDEDGNGIFENLQARLKTAAPDEKIPVIIVYQDSTWIQATSVLRGRNLLTGRNLKYLYRHIPAVAASLSASEIEKLRTDPLVEHVELDAATHICMDTAKVSFGVNRLRNQFGFTGDGDGIKGNFSRNDIVIAMGDTGISSAHPDLKGKVLYWKDFLSGQPLPYDDMGHGTHVAGVATGTGSEDPKFLGVAPQASLVVFKVLDSGGNGLISDAIAAVDEAISKKLEFNIRIFNFSLTVQGSSDGNDALSQACNRAVTNGIVMVVAAGNDGPEQKTIGAPGAASSVITVGAGTDVGEGGFYIEPFSSRGPTADNRIKPDIWAPGVRLKSPNRQSGYRDVTGTSFASPFVSGVIALILQANRSLTPLSVKSLLLSNASKWAPEGKNSETGAGRLQAYQAVTRAATITNNLKPPEIPKLKSVNSTLRKNESQTIHFRIISKRFPVAITIVTRNHPEANIDLQLVSPSGKIVEAKSSERQETLVLRPSEIGDYTLNLDCFLASTPYLLDISGDLDLENFALMSRTLLQREKSSIRRSFPSPIQN